MKKSLDLINDDTKRIVNHCHAHYKGLKPKRKLSEWNLFVQEVYKRSNKKEKKKLEALGRKEKFQQLHNWYDQWQKNGTVPNDIKRWKLKRSGKVQMKKLQAKLDKQIPEQDHSNEQELSDIESSEVDESSDDVSE